MNVLHVANHVHNRGNGIINVLVDLACTQQQDGCRVAVASGGGEYQDLLSRMGVVHYDLDQSRRPLSLLRAAIRFRRIVQEFRPDIVHAHMMTGVVLGYFFRWGRRYGLVSTVHNEFQRSAILMALADRVIAVSDAVGESMIKRGTARSKIRIVKNGTLGSPRLSKEKASFSASLQRPAVVTVAGMYMRKGIGTLIEAFSSVLRAFPDAHLYLVGDGPDRDIFEKMSARMGMNASVHFEGFQPNPRAYLNSADIFVLASLREPFALVLPEARESGIPIIASCVDGNPEALEHGRAGILVPPGDASALAEAVSNLLKHPAKRKLWAFRSRQNIEWLSVERVKTETTTVYRELIPF